MVGLQQHMVSNVIQSSFSYFNETRNVGILPMHILFHFVVSSVYVVGIPSDVCIYINR